MTTIIHFRSLDTQQIVYSYAAESLEMMFVSLIDNGFRNSPYYLVNCNVEFNYFVGPNNVLADSMLSLAEVGLADGSFVDVEMQAFAIINFRLRDQLEIIHSHRVHSFHTQFKDLVNDGFRNSLFYVINRNVHYSFFVGHNHVHANSMLSLDRVGLVDGSFVDIVAQIPVTINFRVRDTQQIVYSHHTYGLDTMFVSLINDGFRNSPYYRARPLTRYNYFVGQNNISFDSTFSLAGVGLVDGGFVDVVAVSYQDVQTNRVSGTTSFEKLSSSVLSRTIYPVLITPTEEMSNYLVVSRVIMFLDFEVENIDHAELFSYVDYSGISQRDIEELRKRFNEHEYDEKDCCMMEIIHWNQEMAEAWGFETPEQAAIATEFAVALFDGAFADDQEPGIGSEDANYEAWLAVFGQGEDHAMEFFEMVYNAIVEALIKRDILF